MVNKAKTDGMPAVAITDHGNMFGAFKFVAEANKAGIKPIVGCEFYLVADRHKRQFSKEQKDQRYHQLMLAKDPEGYKNLSRLCSLGYIEGSYGKYPRIDKELVLQYHKGLIATTCCLGAEVPQLILKSTVAEAEKAFCWWLDLFGEDYYIELQRHNLNDQDKVNEVLLGFAKKYNVKIIASNDSHYIDQEDSVAHDILLCVNTGNLRDTPIGEGKNDRFGFPNSQFYFKSQSEMIDVFYDLPEAIDNTNEIVDKIHDFKLKRDVLMPNYPLPAQFANLDDFLRHLTFQGAAKKYSEVTQEVQDRLDFELRVIQQMGFAGYFLIVQDFINAGKDMGVLVGPGRGSAAGSAVAYCIGITNIDPIKYSLLFERFLNPERVSMPDIDVDFDDDGRQRVIDYVIDKYGKNQVAQIITFGTMASKTSIKDVARVLDLPLNESVALTKLIPDDAKNLKQAFESSDDLKAILKAENLQSEVLELALELEGSVRNTGIHASAVIIAPEDLLNLIPVCTSKDADLFVTQFDGKLIESAGMLKMDFLGLRTLTIMRDAILMIKRNKNVDIVLDDISLEDEPTYKLYQNGDTVATFQFESDGMRKYLKELKPTNIDDLIAMNALYRPGPMDYIPLFISRKNGKEPIEYPHELLTDMLKPTNGIMVYQEQIMQTAQIMAGYSLGAADVLRRAMGKKDAKEMEKQRAIFTTGVTAKGIPEEKAKEIFDIMEKFAEYGFNRSHAAAYSVLAFQTAYLKANFPSEYMAAVLTHHMGFIDKLAYFMEECARMGIPVLGPDVNESFRNFDVNKAGKIRYGLAGIKGNGEAASDEIIREREQNGDYKDLFDFLSRVNLKSVSRKSMECLIYAGAFDGFGYNRATYFQESEGTTIIDKLIRYGTTIQSDKGNNMLSLFGGSAATTLAPPKLPSCEPMPHLEQLAKEKEVLGIYLSGHPLDPYQFQLNKLASKTISNLEPSIAGQFTFGGLVSARNQRTTKNGDPFLSFSITDYTGTYSANLYKKDFNAYQHLFQPGVTLLIIAQYESWIGRDDKELRVKSVQFLSEVADKKLHGLELTIEAENINEELTDKLVAIIQEHQGKKVLKVRVIESEGAQEMNFLSSTHMIDLNKELIAQLSELTTKCEVIVRG
jgi:DNA polymerase-3 subunit alpha